MRKTAKSVKKAVAALNVDKTVARVDKTVEKVDKTVEEVQKKTIKVVQKEAIKHLSLIARISNYLYDNFKSILIGVVIVFLLSYFLVDRFPALRLVTFSLITIVFLVIVPNFFAHKGLKSIYNLIANKNLTIEEILKSYLLAVVSTIFFFTMLYGIVESANIGYLKYGECNDNIKLDPNDSSLVTSPLSRMYFSSITFFTVGYGDICPMGWSKLISILNAFFGSLINIIVISIAIGQYLNTDNATGKEK